MDVTKNKIRVELMKRFLILLILSFAIGAQAFVKDAMYDDLEGASLIRALIKDGKLELAQPEIASYQKNNHMEATLFLGQWYYLKNDWKLSLRELAKIPATSDFFPEAQIWQGRANYQSKQYKECAGFYGTVFSNKYAIENDALWKFECEQKMGQKEKAWITLQKARKAFPSFNVESEWITLMVKLKLVHEGLLTSMEWLATHASPATHFMNLAEIFQTEGATAAALGILEMARAQHPTNLDINLALSQIYFQKGSLNAAEEGFRRAAINDSKYFYHTAELNRQTHRFERSLYFNASVVDEKERLKQKIATYVDANKYALIASLDSVIQRSELQKDDEIRYALAYSLVRSGDLAKPLKYLSQITKPDLIEKTTVLRQTLIDCKEKQGVCRL
jgi:tetratricopeptide (TPR) repeat protein